MVILGVDPGYATTGFGLIRAERGTYALLRYGTVTTPAGLPFPQRLNILFEDMTQLLEVTKPEAVAVEELFWGHNITTGFLDAGKTKFIQETLEDERFNAGERTLLLICEEGEEEYDLSAYPYQHVYPEVIDQEAVTTEELSQLFKKHHCERVVVELNGMLQVGPFYQKMPEDWQIAQEVMFADGTSILAYNANMRSLVVDKLTGCEMVVFNRLAPGTDIMPLHKLARALNRRVGILYEYTDGTTQPDEIEDPLPFDINAPVVEIGDDDFALWYRDITEEPKKYDGKTVRFKGQVARLKKDRDGYFAPGRFVMTCCVEDIAFMGLPCKYADAASLHAREWVTVEATVSVRFHALYRGTGPILTAIRVTPAEPAKNEVATF